MYWDQLLSPSRLCRPGFTEDPGRDAFQRDADRIVYSSAFRRLAHKTQVHPLSDNDHVHTRLTHSVEVASVGRSLGTIVGETIFSEQDRSGQRAAVGNIVQAACLAHDIGNPPFGHSGEEAIRSWFSSNAAHLELRDDELDDFKNFDGNAQGFRVLTALEDHRFSGGLQLTYATLGAYSKYTRASAMKADRNDAYLGARKIGFFGAEKKYFDEMVRGVGLIRRPDSQYVCRHPLSYLVEAADDICYTVVDIEDGYELGHLTFSETKEVLAAIAERADPDLTESEQIAKLRGTAIRKLVKEAAKVFTDHRDALLDGSFEREILSLTGYSDRLNAALDLAKRKLYRSAGKTKLELAGERIIHGLLDDFMSVITELRGKGFDANALEGRSHRLARIVGRPFASAKTAYEATLAVTDFISAMTDRFALDLYRSLNG